MPNLVHTVISNPQINTIFGKTEFLDIEDNSENIDLIILWAKRLMIKTHYAPLQHMLTKDSSSEIESIQIKGTDEFLY